MNVGSAISQEHCGCRFEDASEAWLCMADIEQAEQNLLDMVVRNFYILVVRYH